MLLAYAATRPKSTTPKRVVDMRHGDMVVPPLSATGFAHKFKGVRVHDGRMYAYIGSTNYEYDDDTTFDVAD